MSMRAGITRILILGSILLCYSLFASHAFAQNIQFTQGSVGSGLDNTIQIPLIAYPGRGEASLPVTLYYSSRVWRISHIKTIYNSQWVQYQTVSEAIYAEYSTAGWKSSLDLPLIEWPKAQDAYYYSGGPYCFDCNPTSQPFRVARLFIHMPDGSRHELRKSDQPHQGGIDMQGTFYAVDGSRLRYDSTGETTGTLYLPNGSRYILNGATAQFVDRHGNTLNYAGGQWTDVLGRNVGLPIPANPAAQDYSYLPPGLSQPYIFRFKALADALAPDQNGQTPARKPIANDYLPSPGLPPTAPGGGNYPVTIQQSYSERPTLFISDSNGEEPPTIVVGRGQVQDALFNPVVLAEIILPNGLSYKFSYSIYGEIERVVYPTGAFERYEYGEIPSIGSLTAPYTQANRGIIKRQTSASGTGNDLATWTYASTGTVVTTTAPDGTRTESYKHNFTAPPRGRNGSAYWPFGFEDARDGLAYDERIYAPQAQGGAMLRRKLTEWEQSSNDVPPRLGAQGEATEKAYRNPRVKREVSLILDTGSNALAKTIAYSYDSSFELTTGLDLTGSTEYHFAEVDENTAKNGGFSLTASNISLTIAPGSIARSLETTYLTDASYRSARNILGLATSSTIRDANGQIVAKSETFYDEAAYPLLPYGDLAGVSDYTDPQTAARGLATTVRRYVDVGANIFIETHAQYDQCGGLRVFTNERGVQTLSEYSSAYRHAYLTGTLTAAPDPSAQHGSSAGFTSSSSYDYTTGLLLSTTDANGQSVSFSYRDEQNNPDPLNRLRKVSRPDGGWTRYSFNDQVNNLYTLVETKQDETRTLRSYQYFDAAGRTSRSLLSEGDGSYIASEVKYDQLGRTCKASNPYRTQTLGGASTTGDCAWAANWTVTSYDPLGRVTQITLPDSTVSQLSYQGVYTTATDAAGKLRRQKTDALGRIIRVDEPGADGSLGTLDAPSQATYYDYDSLDNLVHIQQGAGAYVQHRYFKFDALSRLIYERHVEQAAIFNAYDALTGNSQWSRKIVYDEGAYKGLVTSQWDARNIKTSYSYDNLNRVTQVSYSDGVTPTVSYFYDLVRFTNSQDTRAIYNLGRLVEVRTASLGNLPSTSQGYNFDLMGRVANSRQMVGVNSYSLIYHYNQSGALKSQRYPSGRVVEYAYDDAARISGVSSGGVSYTSQFTYNDRGLLSSFTLGNGAQQNFSYNARLQLASLELAKSGAVLQRYEYRYGKVNANGTVDETKNNGQIAVIDSFIGGDKQWQQRYEYDSIGRLSRASEYQGSGGQLTYQMNYEHDAFGNRYQKQATNSASLPFVAVEDSHINRLTNRFNVTGIAYDEAGNILSDSRFTNRQYLYDANNRQRQASQLDGTGAVVSLYDGLGQRVAQMSNNTIDNILVYDTGGKLLAEYGQAPVSRGRSYMLTDHQASTRAIMNSSGAVVSRHDYQSYGTEIGAGVGLRATDQGYDQADSARQRYAGMEQDEASGMSHTLWRKYDSSSGRWTSPDPYSGSMVIDNPQSFNRYSYVNNDPVNQTDILGLMPSDIGVYQTENPEVVRKVERAEDQGVKNWVAARSGSDNISNKTQRQWLDKGINNGVIQNAPAFIPGQVGQDEQFANHGSLAQDNPWDFNTLWAYHPKWGYVVEQNGDAPKGYEHQCTMKMAYTLIRSGVNMISYKGNKYKGYATRVYELGDWLKSVLGPPLMFSPTGPYAAEALRGLRGIVLFRDFWGNRQGHVDLWDGRLMRLANGHVYGPKSYFARSKEIWFWELR